MRDVVIVGAVRTPIGDFLGSLKDVSQIDLGVAVVNGALRQANIEPADVDMGVEPEIMGIGPAIASIIELL